MNNLGSHILSKIYNEGIYQFVTSEKLPSEADYLTPLNKASAFVLWKSSRTTLLRYNYLYKILQFILLCKDVIK